MATRPTALVSQLLGSGSASELVPVPVLVATTRTVAQRRLGALSGACGAAVSAACLGRFFSLTRFLFLVVAHGPAAAVSFPLSYSPLTTNMNAKSNTPFRRPRRGVRRLASIPAPAAPPPTAPLPAVPSAPRLPLRNRSGDPLTSLPPPPALAPAPSKGGVLSMVGRSRSFSVGGALGGSAMRIDEEMKEN